MAFIDIKCINMMVHVLGATMSEFDRVTIVFYSTYVNYIPHYWDRTRKYPTTIM